MTTHEENQLLTGLLEAYRTARNELENRDRSLEWNDSEINGLKNVIENQRTEIGRLGNQNDKIKQEKAKVQGHRDRIEERLRAARKAATNTPGDKRTVQQTLEDTRKALGGEARNEKDNAHE